MLEYLTSGESHGSQLSGILQGMPSGLKVDRDFINYELWRRQQGFGRGGRQKIEADKVEITGGIYRGVTTGAPIGLSVINKDVTIDKLSQLFRPRPGHADLAGALKYQTGIREILERASARETAVRMAVGALAKMLLREFKIEVAGHVIQIGQVKLDREVLFADILKKAPKSEAGCVSKETERLMILEVKRAMNEGDSVGGKFEVRAKGLPVGLGSHVDYRRKLDGRLAQALMSLQSVKAVEFGLGVESAGQFGSLAHDEIFYDSKRGYYFKTNHAGGITGGMTNGTELSVKVTMKPIATLKRPLWSVNMKTKKPEKADFERADVCAVPAGSVVGESIVAFELAAAFLEKFGGDSMLEIERNYKGYLKTVK